MIVYVEKKCVEAVEWSNKHLNVSSGLQEPVLPVGETMESVRYLHHCTSSPVASIRTDSYLGGNVTLKQLVCCTAVK